MQNGGVSTPVATTIGKEFRNVHDSIRRQIEGLSTEALNWVPAEGANSIAVLVIHTLGSEHEMLRAVRAIETDRDRDSEFVPGVTTAQDLIALIELANAHLAEQIEGMTAEDLHSPRMRGNRGPRPGIEWLVTNYGHTREHLAQIELTKQLYEAGHK